MRQQFQLHVQGRGRRTPPRPTPTSPLAFLSFPLSQWRGKVFGFPKQTPRTHVVLAQPSLPVGERWNDGGVDGERGNSCAGREPDRSCLNWGKESSVWAGAQMRAGLCCGERTVFMFFLTLFLARSFGPERRHSVSPGLRTHGTLLLSGKTKKSSRQFWLLRLKQQGRKYIPSAINYPLFCHPRSLAADGWRWEFWSLRQS